MKKRAFLLPLAASVAALIAGSETSLATTTTAPIQTSISNIGEPAAPPAPKPLVIERSNSGPQMAQYGHSSHASHASHGSHASHRSHYSSR